MQNLFKPLFKLNAGAPAPGTIFLCSAERLVRAAQDWCSS